jgi:hypothetical protein
MLYFAVFANGRASIKNEEGQWWCGRPHDWVHPNSSHWHFCPNLWNFEFPSLDAALKFARRMRWLK